MGSVRISCGGQAGDTWTGDLCSEGKEQVEGKSEARQSPRVNVCFRDGADHEVSSQQKKRRRCWAD